MKRNGQPTGTVVFIHPCSVCGSPHAPFGEGVYLRAGRPGTWFCAKHWRERNDKKQKTIF